MSDERLSNTELTKIGGYWGMVAKRRKVVDPTVRLDLADQTISDAQTHISLLMGEIAVLREQVAAVEALHRRDQVDRSGYCAHCSSLAQEYVTWPCATRQALTGEIK